MSRFREFLSTTGMVTKLLIVDNGTIFSNVEVLTFLQTVGITKVRGNANHSRSRGLVESSIRILQTLLRKLLAINDKYDYEHLLFLAPVLLNRAKNPITKISPYELLYCRDISTLGNLGVPITIPECLLPKLRLTWKRCQRSLRNESRMSDRKSIGQRKRRWKLSTRSVQKSQCYNKEPLSL